MSMDNRAHLNYSGDVRSVVGEVVGPTHMGELLVAEEATYDPATGKTRVVFRYAVMADLERVLAEANGVELATVTR